MTDELRAFYDRYDESGRLARWDGRLELVRTLVVLDRHLPPPPARVLDVGGGPGTYAIELRRRGFDVALIDMVPLHVEQARAAGVPASLGDARALEAPDASADVVLLLGPLYHLPEPADRVAALAEARRVLRRGGVLAVAAISRFASTFDGLRHGLFDDAGYDEVVERDVATGVHLNPQQHPRRFTTSYFHRPDELAGEVRGAGFELRELVGVEGPAEFIEAAHRMLDDPARAALLLRAIARVEHEPSLLGASAHLLAVASR